MVYCHTHLNPRKVIPEQNSGEICVETAGYIPRQDLIEQMILAGARLDAYRESQYMYRDNSLAELDAGMPEDIFMDKLEANDMLMQMHKRAEDRKAKLLKLRQDQEARKKASEATPTDEATVPAQPAAACRDACCAAAACG